MPLFPPGEGEDGGAPARMRYMRERGTRKLLAGLVAVFAIWYIVGQVQDRMLLAKKWPTLKPVLNGLTVVGILNPKGEYTRTLFKVTTENTAARVALTEYGWNSVFNPNNSPLCNSVTSGAIQHALNVDDVAGEAMLAPFIKAEVQYMMYQHHQGGDASAFTKLTDSTLVTVPPETLHSGPRTVTMGSLIKEFSMQGGSSAFSDSSGGVEGGGSGSGRSVEHLIYLGPKTVASVCPVVLTGSQFTGGFTEEEPTNLITGPAWTDYMDLTPEGRSRFFQWSHAHQGEDLIFVLDGEIICKGNIGEVLDTTSWGIENIRDEGAARKLVDYVNKPVHP